MPNTNNYWWQTPKPFNNFNANVAAAAVLKGGPPNVTISPDGDNANSKQNKDKEQTSTLANPINSTRDFLSPRKEFFLSNNFEFTFPQLPISKTLKTLQHFSGDVLEMASKDETPKRSKRQKFTNVSATDIEIDTGNSLAESEKSELSSPQRISLTNSSESSPSSLRSSKCYETPQTNIKMLDIRSGGAEAEKENEKPLKDNSVEKVNALHHQNEHSCSKHSKKKGTGLHKIIIVKNSKWYKNSKLILNN